jgi:hypothetical protein
LIFRRLWRSFGTLSIMRKSPSVRWWFISALVLITVLPLLSGCSDSDVTSSYPYNFSSFSGTEWKTKVKVALAEIDGTGLYLIAPDSFDPTDPHYRPIAGCKLISVQPVGSRIRIASLMKDNGDWGGVQVTATLEDGSTSPRTVYVERELLAKNCFLYDWVTSPSTNWDVNTNIFEKP